MKERRTKKLIELYQGQTVSEKDFNLILLSSALVLMILVLVLKDDLSSILASKEISFRWFGFVIGILLSIGNFRAWVSLVSAMSGKGFAFTFFVLKPALIVSAFLIVIKGQKAFALSTLGGFLIHLFFVLFFLIFVFILKPYIEIRRSFT